MTEEIKKREKEEKNAMIKKMAEEFSQKDGASKAMAMLLMTAYSEGMEVQPYQTHWKKRSLI